MRYFAKPKQFGPDAAPVVPAQIPEHVPRHSLTARAFHWIMAVAMFTLLFTAFLPKVGVQFDWVTYHWIAGAVLTLSIMFHIIHASFFMDFWSIWPDRIDLRDARRRVLRFIGKPAPPPERFAKYPLENKLYHTAIIAAGLSAIVTGVFMMFRVRTIFFPRNPYLFSDMTWGMMYVLHGLAGVGLIALIMMHVYFGLRPEKRAITKSMILAGDGPRLLSERARSSTMAGRNFRSQDFRATCEVPGSEDRGVNRCWLRSGIAVTLWKSVTSLCWPTQPQGLPSDQGSESGGQVREFLHRAVKAMEGLSETCALAVKEEGLEPVDKYLAFFAVLDRDARDSLAAIELVLAQPAISSQLIDNLNASIHLRALLTDLFLVSEILGKTSARN